MPTLITCFRRSRPAAQSEQHTVQSGMVEADSRQPASAGESCDRVAGDISGGLLKAFGRFIGSVAGHLLSEFDDDTVVDDAVEQTAAASSDLTRAADAALVSERVQELSEIVGAAGVVDVEEGVEMLMKGGNVQAMGAIVKLISKEELERGMALARLAGELSVVSEVVSILDMPVLAEFQEERCMRLQQIAADQLLRFTGTRALAGAILGRRREVRRMMRRRRRRRRLMVAGAVVVGAIMIPVAMAYAQMAGVPPQAGLYSAIIGMSLYAVFATSRHLKITTSSTMSIMSIAVVAPLAAGNAGAFMALSSALAITVGIIMIVLAFLKLGFISDFLAKSVMTGYIFGVALLIAMSQLPKVFGVPGGSGTFFQQLGQFIVNLPQTNPYALALGAGTIALILIIKRFKPLIPGALIALVLGTLIAGVFQLNATQHVAVVGDIPIGMPSPTIPLINWQGREVTVVSQPAQSIQADGEVLPAGSVTVRVLPSAVRFMVPGNVSSEKAKS